MLASSHLCNIYIYIYIYIYIFVYVSPPSSLLYRSHAVLCSPPHLFLSLLDFTCSHTTTTVDVYIQDGVYGQAFGERRRSQGGSFHADDSSNEPFDAASVKEIRGLSKSQWALVGGLPAESRALIREPVPWKRSTERQDALAALAAHYHQEEEQQQTPPPDG